MKEQLNEVARFKQLAGILKEEEDLQTTFYDDIKNGKLEIAGMYVVDVQEDKIGVYFRLADEPYKNGQKLADIQKATATYNKQSGQFSISGETKTKSPVVNDPESKKTLNYIKGKIGGSISNTPVWVN